MLPQQKKAWLARHHTRTHSPNDHSSNNDPNRAADDLSNLSARVPRAPPRLLGLRGPVVRHRIVDVVPQHGPSVLPDFRSRAAPLAELRSPYFSWQCCYGQHGFLPRLMSHVYPKPNRREHTTQ